MQSLWPLAYFFSRFKASCASLFFFSQTCMSLITSIGCLRFALNFQTIVIAGLHIISTTGIYIASNEFQLGLMSYYELMYEMSLEDKGNP